MASHVESLSKKRKAETESGGPPEKVSTPSVTSQAPRGINVGEFAEARALELHNMIREIGNADKKGSKRIFQSLPKHMRRRAVSHNAKRMPVRLREFLKKESKQETNQPEAPKKKSRRQRRKTKALLDDYNRRKKQNIWLESHIWHSKRMKMVNVWGYKMAEHPSDKSFRACHRAVATTCLLQDISYYSCIEIKGYRCDIISAMSQITRTELGPTMASLDYINTGKEGHVMLYQPHQFPYNAIGPVSFIWRQFSSNHKDQGSQLWIWVHPACYSETLEVIENVCSHVSTSRTSTSSDLPSSIKEERQIQDSDKSSLIVSSLRLDLVRLRLTGPLAHPLLAEMLEIECGETGDNVDYKEKVNGRDTCESNNNSTDSSDDKQDNDVPSCNVTSEEVWKSLKSVSYSSVIPPNSTLALTVLDPRLSLPGKRTSIDATVAENRPESHDGNMSSLHSKWPSRVAASNLWDSDTRQHVKETKLDDHEMNSMRSKLLLPGTRLDLGDKTSHVPILLIHQSGKQGYGAGWDIILPSGWTMPFWISLVYRGARVGGLRESRNCALESEVPYFPGDLPDTKAGKQYNDETQREGESNYSRYPPNKRPNYHKLGITSPFVNPWNTLVKEWIGETQLKTLDSSMSTQINIQRSKKVEIDNTSTKTGKKSRDSESLPKKSEKLIDTKLFPNKTESSTNNTELLPSNTESAQNTADSCDSNVGSTSERFYVLRDFSKLKHLRNLYQGPKSKVCNNSHHLSEDKLTLNPALNIMKDNLRALVAVSLRMINQGCPQANATVSIPSNSDLKELKRCKKFGGPTEPLHKGPRDHMTSTVGNSETMIGCCTRKVMGFVTSGQYSLSRGYGVAIAYCVLPGLVELLSTGNEGIVLIRNASSQQYRFAYLSIL